MVISLWKDPSYLLLTTDHTPTKHLQDILTYCNIETKLSTKEIVQITQKVWLRPAGLERWELTDTTNDENKIQLLKLLNTLGIVQALHPTTAQYDYVLFMGGDLPGMRERLAFMLTLLNQGIRCKKIIFLTAQRFLDPIHESVEKIYNTHLNKFALNISWKKPVIDPITEFDLLKILLEQTELPVDLAKIPTEYINTPNKIRDDHIARATTPDAVIEWRKTNPIPGACLIISSQPLIGYQHAVTRTLLDKDFMVESCGPSAASDVSCKEYFDTLARWLYQECILRKII